MTRLSIRLLGGFDVRLSGTGVSGFESQKVRALLAYLACNAGKPISRELLASLLWSDKSYDAARRNLRQALHNLRSACAAAGASAGVSADVVRVQQRELELDPEVELELDVRQFESGIESAFAGSRPDPASLAAAVRHYRGDFLAGFFIRDSPPFEEWMILEQERLREAAIEGYRSLVRLHLDAGEHRLGIEYARRLLTVDPLSEEAHRQLMRLYALVGRRGPALALYDKLRNLLNSELGVEPLAETAALYESILAEQRSAAENDGARDGAGPLIPLVGRGEAFSRLQVSWQQVVEGQGRVTLIQGGSGIGKTRLSRSFVDGITAQRRAVVIRGRGRDSAPLAGFGLVADILASAFADSLPEEQEERVSAISDRVLTDLTRLAPKLLELVPATSGRLLSPAPAKPSTYAESLVEFLELLMRDPDGSEEPTPAIVMIDDLQWGDPDSLELLRDVARRITGKRIWILATCRSGGPTAAWLQARTGKRGTRKAVVERLTLTALGSIELAKIADFLVSEEAGGALASFLEEWSGGVPEMVAELLNFLWDEEVLVRDDRGSWKLTADPGSAKPPSGELEELMALRIRRLPASPRRLLTVAAILGQEFDTARLRGAEREDRDVVDRCVELLLERWFIRQSARSWSLARRPSDLARWADGARRGPFEFSHEELRAAVLNGLNPLRRQVIHRAVSASLRQRFGADSTEVCEDLAHHDLEAGDWELATSALEVALEKSRAVGAVRVAEWYEGRLWRVLDRLMRQAESRKERARIEARRAQLKAPADEEPKD